MVEGIICRYRTGIPWRDLPESFGPWQTAWKRHHRFSGDGTWDKIRTELLSQADAAGLIEWEVSVDSTVNRAHQHGTNLRSATGGELSNYTNLLVEPPDHAIGRSRGGLTMKIHALCEANMRPLVLLLGTGQGGDSPMFPHVMSSLRVPRRGTGRPRTKPDRTMADKAYASKANRKLLRDRGIQAVIPEKSDHIAKRNGGEGKAAGLQDSTRRPTSAAT